MSTTPPATKASNNSKEESIEESNNTSNYTKIKHTDYLPVNSPCPQEIKDEDFIYLKFSDGKQMFTQALLNEDRKKNKAPLKINKRKYNTHSFVGKPYGIVMELENNKFIPLSCQESLLSDAKDFLEQDQDDNEWKSKTQEQDNRNLVDNNANQSMDHTDVSKLKQNPDISNKQIISSLIQSSSTYESKTTYAKQKYIKRKQKKYCIRFRIYPTNTPLITRHVFEKECRKVLQMREDTLAQILSFANVHAGISILCFEQCQGIVTGALASRMGGYGLLFSIYMTQQQPGFLDFMQKFNLNFAEWDSIKWLSGNSVFYADTTNNATKVVEDEEALDRGTVHWPCPIQDHTRSYLENKLPKKDHDDFLLKRSKRLSRKLTRSSQMENISLLDTHKCESLVIIVSYDPHAVFTLLFQYLKPSSPFVIASEYMEPLVELFQYIMQNKLAINVRLSDSWMREFQVEMGRTHPVMNTSQSGGFLLTGIKVVVDENEDEREEQRVWEILKEARLKHKKSTRAGQKRRKALEKEQAEKKNEEECNNDENENINDNGENEEETYHEEYGKKNQEPSLKKVKVDEVSS